MVEHRHEQRVQRGFEVRIWGRDSEGKPFAETVTATNNSKSGALLSGLSGKMRSGDLIWVEYEKRKARFRIVWVSDSKSSPRTQAAVHRLEQEECPWSVLQGR
jgi:hypothetical protein